MQTHQLTITTNNRPEVLERLARVIRHRGFNLVNLTLTTTDDELNLNLTVSSQRDIYLLKNQLIKLYDVKTLN